MTTKNVRLICRWIFVLLCCVEFSQKGDRLHQTVHKIHSMNIWIELVKTILFLPLFNQLQVWNTVVTAFIPTKMKGNSEFSQAGSQTSESFPECFIFGNNIHSPAWASFTRSLPSAMLSEASLSLHCFHVSLLLLIPSRCRPRWSLESYSNAMR